MIVPFRGLRCRLKDALLDVAILVFSTDNEADVFALLQRIVTRKVTFTNAETSDCSLYETSLAQRDSMRGVALFPAL